MDVVCRSPQFPGTRLSTPWIIISDDVDIDPILQRIHVYIADVFGPSMSYHLEAFGSNFIPKLGIFSSNVHMPRDWIVPKTQRGEYLKKLEELLENCPTQKYLLYHSTEWNFQPNSKILNTEELDLWECKNSNDILENFNGSKLYFVLGNFDNNSATRLLENWMKDQGPPNLEYLHIKNSLSTLDEYQILRNFDVKKFDSPRQFRFWRRYLTRSNPQEISFEFYIVRPSDGNVASVLISPEEFRFVDWKMPLDQLLEHKTLHVYQ